MREKSNRSILRVTLAGVILVILFTMPVQAANYEYDKLNRLTKVTYEDGSYVTYEYDANGNIKHATTHDKDSEDKPDQPTDPDTPATPNTPESSKNSTAAQPPAEIAVASKKANYTVAGIGTAEAYAVFNGLTKQKTTSYTIPKTITYDGVVYPVTQIGDKAFYKNTKLKKLTISANVTTIGAKAFYGAKNLKKITVKSKQLEKVGKNALKGIHKEAVIKVPSKQLKEYRKLFAKKGQKKSVVIRKA